MPDVLEALRDLGAPRAARPDSAQIVAVTGSVGKTGTKEALRLVLGAPGATHASVASYNNHWGVPLTLARMPRDAALRRVRDRHEPRRRDRAADADGAAARRDRHHGRAGAHRVSSARSGGIADAKAEIFEGLEPAASRSLNRDNRYYERLRAHARSLAGAGASSPSASIASADVRAERIILQGRASRSSQARVLGTPVIYRLGTPGRHMAPELARRAGGC